MTIENGSLESKPAGDKPPRSARGNPFWQAATALALAAIVVLFINIHQLGTSVAQQRDATTAQIAKLGDLIAQNNEASRQRVESVAREAHDSAMTAEEQAKADLRRAMPTWPPKSPKKPRSSNRRSNRRNSRWRGSWMS